jgi:hypothetical protein
VLVYCLKAVYDPYCVGVHVYLGVMRSKRVLRIVSRKRMKSDLSLAALVYISHM